MNTTSLQVVAIAVAVASVGALSNTQPPAAQGPDYNAFYQIGPDSLPHDGVPKGEVRGPFVLPSQAYPGTQHTYWIYVPAQYDPAVAASLMVFQDGQAFKDMDGVVRAPNVLDNLRGGDAYADIVRQNDHKPIRVFLQDGRNDNRGVGRGGVYDQRRDWFYQNVRLMQALTDKGYDVNYTWGINTHGQRMGGPILPEMMRWLWRDHPVSTDVNDTVERSFNVPKKTP